MKDVNGGTSTHMWGIMLIAIFLFIIIIGGLTLYAMLNS